MMGRGEGEGEVLRRGRHLLSCRFVVGLAEAWGAWSLALRVEERAGCGD